MTDDLIVAAQALDEDIQIQRVGYLLLAALEVGPSIKQLRLRTGVPWSTLQDASWYLRQNRVWVGQTMHYAWLDHWLDGEEDLGLMGLLLDAMVGTGALRRQGSGLDVEYRLRYFLEDLGISDGPPHMEMMERFHQGKKYQRLPLGAVHPRTGQPRIAQAVYR